MKYAPRAAFSILMLAGAGVLGAAAVLAVATALFIAASTRGAWAVLAAIAVVTMLAVVAFAMANAKRRERKPIEGVLITADEQPLLWVEICIVAEGLHMWPPAELVLSPDAAMIASENRTWLGLRHGVRRLQLGEVLLAGLTERQLRAVIAHELCRFWGPTSAGRVIDRGQEIIGRVAEWLGEESRVGKIVGRYGRLYVAVSRPVIRRHELDADRLSANLVGNGATSTALREVGLLSKAWDAFVDGYLKPAAAVQCHPENAFADFGAFIDYPDRRQELSEALGKPPRPPSTYDSHPSLAERLSAVASLPEDETHDRSGRALDMLRDPSREVRRVHDWMFQNPDLTLATWEEIVPRAGNAAARQGAMTLVRLGHEGGLGHLLSGAVLLDLLRYELADEMVRPLLDEGAPQEAERQMAAQLVTDFFATAAIQAGTASFRFSWAASRQLVNAQGEVDDLPRLVDAALADPAEVGALERWLGTHELGPDLELGEGDGPDVQPGLSAGPHPGQPVVDLDVDVDVEDSILDLVGDSHQSLVA